MRLIVMRHAKSDWSHDLDDHERPLNPRGQSSARALGQWLRDEGCLADEAFVSDAVRTRETWSLLGQTCPVHFERDLYLADPQTIQDVLQSATGKTVMIIGHNPGIASFAADLMDTPPKDARFEQYPTGATLVIDIPGQTHRFIVPRDLI